MRLPDGSLDEAILSPEESARIRLAYAHDSQFAVSISGIRTLPHQIEAVYMKMGFDIRSLAQADPHTGYRDPVTGVRRIEVKGRKRGQPLRLTTNEWYKATQLGYSYWLYVAWDPLENPDAEPIRIQNPAQKLDHVKREVVTTRFFEIPADAIQKVTMY